MTFNRAVLSMLVWSTLNCVAIAQKKAALFQLKKNLRKMSFVLPQYLDFTIKDAGSEANHYAAQPFSVGEILVEDERYVSSYYPEISIIHVFNSGDFDSSEVFDKAEAKKQLITLISKREKRFGSSGTIFKLKQDFPTGTYRKIVAIFSNELQTHRVIALYPEHYESSFVPSLLERSVESSRITDIPYLEP